MTGPNLPPPTGPRSTTLTAPAGKRSSAVLVGIVSMTLVMLWLAVGMAASENEMPDSWVRTESTVLASESDGGLPIFDRCGKGAGGAYRVTVQFDDQRGRTQRAAMDICSYGGGPDVGFAEYKIAYNPADPTEIREAPVGGVGTLVAGLSVITVAAIIAMYAFTRFRNRAADRAQDQPARGTPPT